MTSMFAGSRKFDQTFDEKWNTSNVESMKSMFEDAVFNQDIGDWETSRVENMSRMFLWNRVFDQDIGDWKMYHVIDMSYMFLGATSFNQDLSLWQLHSKTDLTWTLAGSGLDQLNYCELLQLPVWSTYEDLGTPQYGGQCPNPPGDGNP
jgi:hypothetical protein